MKVSEGKQTIGITGSRESFSQQLRFHAPLVFHILFAHIEPMLASTFARFEKTLSAFDVAGKNLLVLREIVGSDDKSDCTLQNLVDIPKEFQAEQKRLAEMRVIFSRSYGEVGDAALYERAMMRLAEASGFQSVKSNFSLSTVRFKNIDLKSTDADFSAARALQEAGVAFPFFSQQRLDSSVSPDSLKIEVLAQVENIIRSRARELSMRDKGMIAQINKELSELDASWVVVILTGSQHYSISRRAETPVHRIFSVLHPDFLPEGFMPHQRQHTDNLWDMKQHKLLHLGALDQTDLRDAALSLLMSSFKIFSIKLPEFDPSSKLYARALEVNLMISRLLLMTPAAEREELFNKICANAPGHSLTESAESVLLQYFWPYRRSFSSESPEVIVQALFERAFFK